MTPHDPTPSPDQPRPSRLRRRRGLIAGSSLAAAGVAAGLVFALGGTTAAPAFAVTQSQNGTVLAHLNYTSNENLPQLNAKLASMGLHEGVTIYMQPGAATTSGPVACSMGTGATTPINVLVGQNGTETIAPGESAGNTAEGTFHLDHCVVQSDSAAGNTGS